MEQTLTPNYTKQKLPVNAYQVASVLLSLLGLIISTYLLYRHHVVAANQTGKVDVCSAVFGRGCDSALKSPVSSLLGLPLAGWGMLYFSSLLLLFIGRRLSGQAFHPQANLSLFLLSFLG